MPGGGADKKLNRSVEDGWGATDAPASAVGPPDGEPSRQAVDQLSQWVTAPCPDRRCCVEYRRLMRTFPRSAATRQRRGISWLMDRLYLTRAKSPAKPATCPPPPLAFA